MTKDEAVRQFTRLAWKFAIQFSKRSGGTVTDEELANELLAHLAAKAHLYDPAKAARSTWAWPVLFNHAVRYVEVARQRGFTGLNHRPAPDRSELSPDPQAAGPGAALVDVLPDREHRGELHWSDETWRAVGAAAGLTDREGQVLYWRFHGNKLDAIGWHLDLSKERVRQIVGVALEKLRDHADAVRAVVEDIGREGVTG